MGGLLALMPADPTDTYVEAMLRADAAADAPPGITVIISARRATYLIWTVSIALLVLGMLHGAIIELGAVPIRIRGLGLFHLDGEQTIPAWYASMLMVSAAALLFLHALISRIRGKPGLAIYFVLLGAIFIVLSLDESISLHETLGRFLPDGIAEAAPIEFTWVIVAAPFLVAGAVAFVPFLSMLPRRTMKIVMAAGFIYVAGAFGIEIVGGRIAHQAGYLPTDTWPYVTSVVAEEGLELVGLSLFLTALLALLAAENPSVRLIARTDRNAERAAPAAGRSVTSR